MSLETFSKNLQYLKKKRNLTQRQIVAQVNKMMRKQLKATDDQQINMKKLGSYLEGRAYCPAYMLPILCKVLGHKNTMSLFTTDLEATHVKERLKVA